MVKFILTPLATAICTILFVTGVSACDFPKKPVLPDPSPPLTPEMVKLRNEVQQYQEAADRYLQCQKSPQESARMIEEMDEVAEKFDAIVNAFEAQQSTQSEDSP